MPTPPLRVVVAPDKFKGTLTGAEAAAAIADGVRRVVPDAVVTTVPLADGGEGTVDAVLASGGRERVVRVPGPDGRPVSARFALTRGTAVLEAAQACGLQLLTPTAQTAVTAHSVGVGELVRAALAAGATRVVVGLGGVASTDGGAGMASALGARLLDSSGARLPPGGGALADLAEVNLELLQEVVARATFVAATDVTNPLLGPDGAAAVYAPQKGAGPEQVAQLERGLTRWADLVEASFGNRTRDVPGAGAAGGLGWGLTTLLGAEVRPGADLVMELLGVEQALARADLVVTGEGRMDRQTTFGKGPVALARAAKARGVPVLAIAGAVEDEVRHLDVFAGLWSLVDTMGEDAALHDAGRALTETTATAVRALLR
ncbi:glycerate kinase [Ornithinimicrobium pekingense]|uniref:Glycerate kinase n=1 Tax=Ornithinimicrobium pekingense TaxID=384677 RepID=A0ABQ2FFB0_9MICO|nr:glycerate kinase [Ornithinimicrobium pekingense]GGK80215.1 glycerate kinase [Ornithinimicrobium pekingense]